MDPRLNLDVYCERAGAPGLWAEPFNAISNLAFLLVAILAWRNFRRIRPAITREDGGLIGLIALVALLGIGSGYWHLHPLKIALLADVLPIFCFVNLYLLCVLRQMFGLAWRKVWLGWAGFMASSALINQLLPPTALNGSIIYAPAVGALLAIACAAEMKKIPGARMIGGAFALIACSVVLRTYDKAWCAQFPQGTHFLWHLLNAYALWLMIAALSAARGSELRPLSRPSASARNP